MRDMSARWAVLSSLLASSRRLAWRRPHRRYVNSSRGNPSSANSRAARFMLTRFGLTAGHLRSIIVDQRSSELIESE